MGVHRFPRMLPRVKTLCSLTVLLALLAAQVVGLARGYWCECMGAPASAASAVCLPAECHPGMTHGVCCQDRTRGGTGVPEGHCHPPGSPDCPEPHGHKFLTQEADFQAFTPMAAPLPLFIVETCVMPPPLIRLEKAPPEGREIPPVRRDGWSSAPPMRLSRLRYRPWKSATKSCRWRFPISAVVIMTILQVPTMTTC